MPHLLNHYLIALTVIGRVESLTVVLTCRVPVGIATQERRHIRFERTLPTDRENWTGALKVFFDGHARGVKKTAYLVSVLCRSGDFDKVAGVSQPG